MDADPLPIELARAARVAAAAVASALPVVTALTRPVAER